MEIFGWIIVLAVLILVIFAADRCLWVKEIEKDLNLYLGDVLVLRDASESPHRVHFEAEVARVKTLIRKHFKL